MILTQGQVRAILDNMEKRHAKYVWTENLPIELCKHIDTTVGSVVAQSSIGRSASVMIMDAWDLMSLRRRIRMSLLDKVYTANDMRSAAKCISCCEFGLKFDNMDTARMLRQAADAIEREKAIKNKLAKIDAMAVAPLNNNLLHQKTNGEKVIAKIEFFESVKEILFGEISGRGVEK